MGTCRGFRLVLLFGVSQLSFIVLYTQLHYSTVRLRISTTSTERSSLDPAKCNHTSAFDFKKQFSNLPNVTKVNGSQVKLSRKDADQICVRDFLQLYDDLCRREFLGPFRNNSSLSLVVNHEQFSLSTDCLCPCIPATIVGLKSERIRINVSDVEHDVIPGVTSGSWSPPNCVARQRVAFIVPYRNRTHHLRTFLGLFHLLLQRQMLDYTIYLVEQLKPTYIFNKAMLMNAGFSVARQRDKYDCFIFHDVDMYPIDDRNFYTCTSSPRHVAAYVDKWGFRMFYEKMFGGSVAFREQEFELVNGYSNTFYGWGGEDDDMYQRTRYKNLKLQKRFPSCVSKYRMMRHSRDSTNPSLGRGDYRVNGLTSLRYTLEAVQPRPLFTRLLISLPDPPPDIMKIVQRKLKLFTNVTTTSSVATTTTVPRSRRSTATKPRRHR